MTLTAGSRAILTALATTILIAGCAQAGSATTAATTAPAPTSAASPAASPGGSTAAGQAYVIAVATDAKLGAYLTGESGKALYLLATDSASKSTCGTAKDCISNWPPFALDTGETATAGTGVTGTIATFQRDDGSTQVTINGLPLYYFAGDKAAGQVYGQGIGGKWHLASPTGTPVGATSSGASPAASCAAGYGYGGGSCG